MVIKIPVASETGRVLEQAGSAVPFWLLGMILTAVAPGPANAQSATMRRWSAGGTFEIVVSAASHPSLERALVRGGVNQEFVCDAFDCIGFPAPPTFHTITLGPKAGVSLGYLLRPRLQTRLIVTSANLGYNYGRGPQNADLEIRQSVTSFGLSVAWLPDGVLRLGGGPTAALVHVTAVTDDGLQRDRSTQVQAGFLLDCGVRFPRRSRFFVDIGAQLRYLFPTNVGPYDAKRTGQTTATMPQSRISFGHTVAAVGLGIRL